MSDEAQDLLRELTAGLDSDEITPGSYARGRAERPQDCDEAIMAALTREIDIRKRLRARYHPGFAEPDGEAAASPASAAAVATLFLVTAQTAKDKPAALKSINTGLKACDLAGEAAARPRAALLALLDRLLPETTP